MKLMYVAFPAVLLIGFIGYYSWWGQKKSEYYRCNGPGSLTKTDFIVVHTRLTKERLEDFYGSEIRNTGDVRRVLSLLSSELDEWTWTPNVTPEMIRLRLGMSALRLDFHLSTGTKCAVCVGHSLITCGPFERRIPSTLKEELRNLLVGIGAK
jgi:hypothetical protein